jgi:hypothetical protein
MLALHDADTVNALAGELLDSLVDQRDGGHAEDDPLVPGRAASMMLAARIVLPKPVTACSIGRFRPAISERRSIASASIWWG